MKGISKGWNVDNFVVMRFCYICCIIDGDGKSCLILNFIYFRIVLIFVFNFFDYINNK